MHVSECRPLVRGLGHQAEDWITADPKKNWEVRGPTGLGDALKLSRFLRHSRVRYIQVRYSVDLTQGTGLFGRLHKA